MNSSFRILKMHQGIGSMRLILWDLCVKLDEISDDHKLYIFLRNVTKGLVQNNRNYKLISYVEKYIPQKHYQVWKNALISMCIGCVNVNILEYLLVSYHPEIPCTVSRF